jgi:hypothetical protein
MQWGSAARAELRQLRIKQRGIVGADQLVADQKLWPRSVSCQTMSSGANTFGIAASLSLMVIVPLFGAEAAETFR